MKSIPFNLMTSESSGSQVSTFLRAPETTKYSAFWIEYRKINDYNEL
jgi:hypothetical protein